MFPLETTDIILDILILPPHIVKLCRRPKIVRLRKGALKKKPRKCGNCSEMTNDNARNVSRGVSGDSKNPTKIQDRTTKLLNNAYTSRMVRRRNKQAQELDLRLSEAVLGIQTRKYKSAQAAYCFEPKT
jgi:hypothetical protein